MSKDVKYTVVLHITGLTKLSALLGALEGEGTSLVMCRPSTEKDVPVTAQPETVKPETETPQPWQSISNGAPRPSRFVGGKRDKGITGEQLLLDTMRTAKAPMSRHSLKTIFKQHGFAESSVDAMLAKLKAKHLVMNLGDSMWCLRGETTIHKGAGHP